MSNDKKTITGQKPVVKDGRSDVPNFVGRDFFSLKDALAPFPGKLDLFESLATYSLKDDLSPYRGLFESLATISPKHFLNPHPNFFESIAESVATLSPKHYLIPKLDLLKNLEVLNPMDGYFKTIHTALGNAFAPNLVKVFDASELARLSITSSYVSGFGKLMDAPESEIVALNESLTDLTGSYSALLKSISSSDYEYRSEPELFVESPAFELFTNADLLEAISVDEADRPESESARSFRQSVGESSGAAVLELLGQFDRNLLKMFQGAVHALESNSPDRIRQFSVSIRELLGHLLRELAPDNSVRKWTKDPEHFVENKPTREARLLFICREITSGPFVKFVKDDVRSMISFIQICNDGTHNKSPEWSETQLIALRTKAEAMVSFLLKIEKQGQRG